MAKKNPQFMTALTQHQHDSNQVHYTTYSKLELFCFFKCNDDGLYFIGKATQLLVCVYEMTKVVLLWLERIGVT
jgi:hypothetical protein